MAYIKSNGKFCNFELNNVKFIKVNDMMNFQYRLLANKIELCDNISFCADKNFIITPLTKLSELLGFTKTNPLGKSLIEAYKEKEELFNFDIVDKIRIDLEEKLKIKIEFNNDFDFLKILMIIFEFKDEYINKDIFKTFISLFQYLNYIPKLLLFNAEWIDDEIIQMVNFSGIKMILIFNDPLNIKNLIISNKEDLLLEDKYGNFHIYDVNKSDKKSLDFDNKVFIKI